MTDKHTGALVSAFLDALRKLPHARAVELVSSTTPDFRPDALVELCANPGAPPVHIVVEAKGHVYPQDTYRTIWQLKRYAQKFQGAHEIVPVLLAQSLSPGAKERLREENVGYYDSGGSLFLPAKTSFVYVEMPAPKRQRKTVRSLFSGSRSRVAHVMLLRQESWFSVKRLASDARVSASTVTETLQEMERLEWVESRGRGPAKERHVAQPRVVLDHWAQHVRDLPDRQLRHYYASAVRSPTAVRDLAELFEKAEIPYALTHAAAAQVYAPYLTSISQTRWRVPADSKLGPVLEQLKAKPVTEGANVSITETLDAALFRQRIDDLWLASPIQVYLDLARSGGRAPEMAEHLRREKLGF